MPIIIYRKTKTNLTRLKHRDMFSLGVRGSRPKDPWPIPPGSLRGSGAISIRYAHVHILARIRRNPSTPSAHARDSGAHLSSGLPINGSPGLILGSTFSPCQGPGWQPTPRGPRLGGSSKPPNGAGAIAHSSNKVTQAAWHKGTNPSTSSRGLRSPSPARQTLKPDAFATKEASRKLN